MSLTLLGYALGGIALVTRHLEVSIGGHTAVADVIEERIGETEEVLDDLGQVQ